nr:GGDEF domain-containing protein [Schwartzia sp. (in: firmicutes)]
SSEMRYLAQTYNDLYESSRKEQETLSYEASHDALTGLGNRAMFERVRNDCDPATTAMILIDIDYFKEVNDTYGHETGDQLLKRAAKVFRASFRSEDCVCRIGGDEFVVVLENSDYKNIDDLLAQFNGQLDEMARDEALEPWERISAAIGVAFYDPAADSSAETVFKRADKAMYIRKKEMKAVRSE